MKYPAIFMLIFSQLLFAQDVLTIDSDAGASPVSASQTLSYETGAIRVANSPYSMGIRSPANAEPYWSFGLQTPNSQPLAVGCYERATRSSVLGRPQMDFSFGSSSCNEAFGRYKILDLQLDLNGVITRLALDFAQQCAGYGRAVRGKIRFNSTIPTTGAFHRSVSDQTGTFSFMATPGAIGSGAPGGSANIALSRLNTTATKNFGNGPSFTYFGMLPVGISGFFNLDFAAPGSALIATGSYPNATRYSFQSPTEAGLDFSYGSAGCNALVGSFDVADVVMDALDPFPLSFNATFRQRCVGEARAITIGSISFLANVIGPTSASTGSILKTGFETGEAGPVSFYSPTCN